MATTKASGPVSAERLKSFIERVEKLEEERKAIGGDIKDVYSEAKGVGYDVKTMRKIVALRAKEDAVRAEEDVLLDVYKHALGMETSGPVTVVQPKPSEEELEALAGRIVMEVDRCMSLVERDRPPSIEAIRNLIGCSLGKASKLRGLVQSRISREIAKVREMKKPEDGDDGITGENHEADRLSAPAEGGGRDRDDSRESAQAEHAVLSGRPANPHEGGEGRNLLAPGLSASPDKGEAPATPSVGAVGPSSGRVAPQIDDSTALAAMEEAGNAWRSSRTTAQGRDATGSLRSHPSREQGGFEQ